MTSIDSTRSVTDFVTSFPGAARVFERLGIDYCCRGMQPLAEACVRANVPIDSALELLAQSAASRGTPHLPQDAPGLIQMIVDRHHVFTRDELARLTLLSAKVLRVHGAREPMLRKVDALLYALHGDLTPHMDKEERVLFPYILQLAAGNHRAPTFQTVTRPLTVMHAEHEHVGTLLRELAEITNGYAPPSFACASFRALYEGLAELQADIHEHIHLENHVLFPLAIRLEAAAPSLR